jgi:hypothetical protein
MCAAYVAGRQSIQEVPQESREEAQVMREAVQEALKQTKCEQVS